MNKIVTHHGKFHTDDVFAVATLFLVLGKENCEVVRTRDEAVVASADYAVDLGGTYDPLKKIFDHHQPGGTGERENGIPYASFGLVWKEFGEKLCGSKEVAAIIDTILVQSVDALDNGVPIAKSLISDSYSFDLSSIVNLYRATWKEEGRWDERFLEVVDWAMFVLKREIQMSKDAEEGRKLAVNAYEASADKQIVAIDKNLDLGRELIMSALSDFPEPLYAVIYRADDGKWQVVAMRKEKGSFASRKRFPEAWGGKPKQELEAETGVPGAVFCHRSGFMCIAATEEAALELAKKALAT